LGSSSQEKMNLLAQRGNSSPIADKTKHSAGPLLLQE
jgi:hypothetical protein